VVALTGHLDLSLFRLFEKENFLIGTTIHKDSIFFDQIKNNYNQGKITFLGDENSIDFELIKVLNPDLILASENSNLLLLDDMGFPFIITYSQMVNSLQKRLDFTDFLATFFNQKFKAEIFRKNINKTLEVAINKTKNLPKTKVTWGIVFEKRVFVEPGNNWLGEILTLLNGDYLFKDDTGDSTIEVSLEHFINSGKKTEVLILYPGQFGVAETKKTILRQNSNLYPMKALQKGGRCYMTKPIFYQSFDKLDQIIIELSAILHPKAYPDYELIFFSKLKDTE
jgi:iron complex transport system substrate-binding protein